MDITGAQLFVKALHEEQVDKLFAYPGGQVTDRKLENYRQLNQTAQKNQILFVGSSLMEMFPIEEFIKERNLPLIAYNRGVGGYKTEDLLNALQVCVYDLSPRRIFIILWLIIRLTMKRQQMK